MLSLDEHETGFIISGPDGKPRVKMTVIVSHLKDIIR